jgi:hypothetical protein
LVAFLAAFLTGGLGACPYYGYSDIYTFLPPPIGCSSNAFLFPPPIGCSSKLFFLPPPIGCSSKLFLLPPIGISSTFLVEAGYFALSYLFYYAGCYYLFYVFCALVNLAGGFFKGFFGCSPY